MTFPVLLDRDGRVGALYQASSIPLTYLIDPAGRIVGLSRGARDWSALGGLLDRIRGLEPPAWPRPAGTELVDSSGASPAPAAPAPPARCSLPADLVPPTATVALSAASPRVGDTFDLDVEVRWAGNFDQYLLHPPQVDLPDGVTRQRVTADTSSTAGRNVVTYHLALTAAAPGRYALDPVELRYTPRGPQGDGEPVAARVAGPTVEVLPATVAGLAPRTLAWTGAGSLAAALAALGLGWWWRARRRRPAGDSAEARYEALAARFAAARKRRLEGDAAGFLAGLAEIESELDRRSRPPRCSPGRRRRCRRRAAAPGEASPAERAAFARALEAARFGGRRLPAAELDPHERRVERRLAALRPDPARREREGIALNRDLIEEGR